MNWLDSRRDFACRNADHPVFCDELSVTPTVVISGERQTGKTEMVIDRMVRHARDGVSVAYAGFNLPCSIEVFRRIEQRQDSDVVRYRRTHGSESVSYESGGSIRFVSPGRAAVVGADVLVLDDVRAPVGDVSAKLIYRVVVE